MNLLLIRKLKFQLIPIVLLLLFNIPSVSAGLYWSYDWAPPFDTLSGHFGGDPEDVIIELYTDGGGHSNYHMLVGAYAQCSHGWFSGCSEETWADGVLIQERYISDPIYNIYATVSGEYAADGYEWYDWEHNDLELSMEIWVNSVKKYDYVLHSGCGPKCDGSSGWQFSHTGSTNGGGVTGWVRVYYEIYAYAKVSHWGNDFNGATGTSMAVWFYDSELKIRAYGE